MSEFDKEYDEWPGHLPMLHDDIDSLEDQLALARDRIEMLEEDLQAWINPDFGHHWYSVGVLKSALSDLLWCLENNVPAERTQEIMAEARAVLDDDNV